MRGPISWVKSLLAVPTADATTNVYSRDVVGIKTDAAVQTVGTTKSIVAYVKGILTYLLVATADATTNTAAKDVIGNKEDAAVTTVATTKTIMAYVKGVVGVAGALADSAVNAVGTTATLMSYVKALVAGSATGAGTTFWVQKSFASTAIVTAGADLTGASSGGDLEIEQIILRTDATGLATGTNVEIESNNALGLADILVEAVANLGANKTITLDNASVTKIRTILTSTKKLTIKSTVGNCDGAGNLHVSIKFRRLVAGATVAAA
jgi:hypothetical protein